MTSRYSTHGGIATRGECFSKMLYHIDELRNQVCLMAHLHRTEDSNIDRLLAKGWLGVNEMLGQLRKQLVELAKGKLQ